MRIFLDLDCVLADFVGGVARHWGLTTDRLLARWEPGVYDCVGPLSRALGLDPPMTEAGFWAELDGDAGFWADLDPLPWAMDLFELVDEVSDNDWRLVTVPSRCLECYKGKHLWCNKFFGVGAGYFDRVIPVPRGADKALFANPASVLVDDNEQNCEAFRAAGGHAVLVPAHHNRLHAAARDPLGYVRPELRRLKEVIK